MRAVWNWLFNRSVKRFYASHGILLKSFHSVASVLVELLLIAIFLLWTGMTSYLKILSILLVALKTTNQSSGHYDSMEGYFLRLYGLTSLVCGSLRRTLWWFDGLSMVSHESCGRVVVDLMPPQYTNLIRKERYLSTVLTTSLSIHLQSFVCWLWRNWSKLLVVPQPPNQLILKFLFLHLQRELIMTKLFWEFWFMLRYDQVYIELELRNVVNVYV